MFAKREWFEATGAGIGVRPVRTEGWVFVGTCLAVMGGPGLWLLGQGKFLETLVWLAATGALATWEWSQLRNQLTVPRRGRGDRNAAAAKPEEEPFVIDENETESARFATRLFELQQRR